MKGLRARGIRTIALFAATVFFAVSLCTSFNPVQVSADEGKYDSLYDVFRERSGDPEHFMTREQMVYAIFVNCDELEGIPYTYGSQERQLACDGFVSLVFRMCFGTVHDYHRTNYKYIENTYSCSYDKNEEHIVADSPVDKYEIFRPGGTSVTWLYRNYVQIVEPRVTREFVEGMDNAGWVNYLNNVGAQPGDILIWDNDYNKDYWTHIGFYAGIENGVAMMWHASAVKGKVCKQSLEEITYYSNNLKAVAILPLTETPARAGLYVNEDYNCGNFTYSVYLYENSSFFAGRISNKMDLPESSNLNGLAIYPNDDNSAYERTIFLKREVSPYNSASVGYSKTDQVLYRVLIRIVPEDNEKGTLYYAIYGAEDYRQYGSGEVQDYYYKNWGQGGIPIVNFS